MSKVLIIALTLFSTFEVFAAYDACKPEMQNRPCVSSDPNWVRACDNACVGKGTRSGDCVVNATLGVTVTCGGRVVTTIGKRVKMTGKGDVRPATNP